MSAEERVTGEHASSQASEHGDRVSYRDKLAEAIYQAHDPLRPFNEDALTDAALSVRDAELDRLSQENDRLRAELLAACTCGKTYETYDGPRVDCPVHGQLTEELHRVEDERANLQEELDAVRLDLQQAEFERDAAAKHAEAASAAVERAKGAAR